MMIREMSRNECIQVFVRSRLYRLACAKDNQPYVVPVYLAYHEASGCLYGFTTQGQKVDWMRANPKVCVEVDEISADDRWVSVIAIGRYDELAEAPGRDVACLEAPERPGQVGEPIPAWTVDSHRDDDQRGRAWQILKAHPEWWEPGSTAWTARSNRNPADPFIPIFYRVRFDHVTGHESTTRRDSLTF